MKHLYWIICGVIILGLVATWILVVPTEEARTSKKKLDDALGKPGSAGGLYNLEARANNKLTGVFDAENPKDTKRLKEEFLISESWRKVLQPHLEKYENQLDMIKKQLSQRSEWLRRPVADSGDHSAWYNTYIKVSEALIKRMRDAGCLHPAQGSTPGETALVSGDESSASVRSAAGLFTKSTDFPKPDEHPLLTARLHIMEMLADRLISARIAVADNPVVGATGRSDDRAGAMAAITAIDWGGMAGDQSGQNVTTVVADLLPARAIGLTMTLEGPVTALVSATAALEHNGDATRPLVVVNSTNLTRRSPFAPGERDDAAAESAKLDLSLSILDFAPATTGVK